MTYYTALVTLLAVALYFVFATRVAAARGKYGVKLPATTGNPDFERTYRAHINTLEWLPIFLPSLWLFAIYISDWVAAALGLVWIAGRIAYLIGYSNAANERRRGFGIQAGATIVLWVGAAGAILWRIVHA